MSQKFTECEYLEPSIPVVPPLTKGARGILKLSRKQIPLGPPFSKGDSDKVGVLKRTFETE
jgi:hypothetical protein